MIINKMLVDDLTLLVNDAKQSGDWGYVKAFFADIKNNIITEKTFIDGKTCIPGDRERHDLIGTWVDSGVPSELIDKVLLWGHYFHPEYMRNRTPGFHRSIVSDYFSKKNEYKAAPRGFSKTTLLEICIGYSCAHKNMNEFTNDPFIALIEKTYTEAAEMLQTVRSMFTENEDIVMVYGDLIGNDSNKTFENDKIKHEDSKNDVFINGVRLRGKGFETGVRGLKSRHMRPTKIICDDIEKDQQVKTQEMRKKYQDNLDKNVIPALDTDGYLKMFGTILHPDSLLNNKLKISGGVIFRAYNPYNPDELLWPDRWPLALLEQKKEDMMTDGRSPAAFFQEYLNDPISEETRKFNYNWLHNKDCRLTWEDIKLKRKNIYITIDAAKTKKITSDWSGAIGHAVDQDNNHYRVYCERRKLNIMELINWIFEIWTEWQPKGLVKIGIERESFEDQLEPLIKEEKAKRGVYPIVVELKPMGRNKEARIENALQGRYASGKIYDIGVWKEEVIDGIIKKTYVPTGHTHILKTELLEFPSSKHDDLSDAEAYIYDIAVAPNSPQKARAVVDDINDDPFSKERKTDRDLDDMFESGTNNAFNTNDDPY